MDTDDSTTLSLHDASTIVVSGKDISMQKVIRLQQCQIRFLIKHVSKEIADMMPSTELEEEEEDNGSTHGDVTPSPIYSPSAHRVHQAALSDLLGSILALARCVHLL